MNHFMTNNIGVLKTAVQSKMIMGKLLLGKSELSNFTVRSEQAEQFIRVIYWLGLLYLALHFALLNKKSLQSKLMGFHLSQVIK